MKLVKENLGKVSLTVEKDYWTSNKSYDKLTIVEVLNVGCYLSRKAVPRGIQYDNREYWIRLSKNVVLPPSPEPTEFPIVTEFGDNVDVTIAQKTLTDRFVEIVNSIETVQTGVSIGFENIDTALERLQAGDIPYLTDRISTIEDAIQIVIQEGQPPMSLQDVFDWFYNDEYLRFAEESTFHINSLETSNIRITNEVNRQINDVNAKMTALSNKVDVAGTLGTKIASDEFIYYYGGRITDIANDSNYIALLKNYANINRQLAYTVTKEVDSYHIMPTMESLLAREDFPKYRALIIQYDTKFRTIGTDADMPDISDTTYTDVLYNFITYIVDKVNAANPNCFVFLVAPPNAPLIDQAESENIIEKTEALEDICNKTGAIFVNPNKAGYGSRYLDIYTTYEIYPEADPGRYVAVINNTFTNNWCKYLVNTICKYL